MAATQLIVIFKRTTGELRRTVPTNSDGSIPWNNLQPDEELLLLPLSGPTDAVTVEEAIRDKVRPAKSQARVSVGL